MTVYLGDKAVGFNSVVEKEVTKTKYGASVDSFLGDVDEKGQYITPTEPFIVDLTGVKSVAAYGLSYKFYQLKNITGVVADDLESVGNYAFQSAFMNSNDKNTTAKFGIEEVNGNYAFQHAFAYGPEPYFYRLKKVTGEDAFSNVRYGLGLDLGKAFPALEEITGEAAFNNFGQLPANKTEELPALKRVVGGNSQSNATFGIYTSGQIWKFPRATEFSGYLFRNYVSEIHFAVANQTAIEACEGYDYKWGATSATIYFDLILTITVNGVAYSRMQTLDGYTAWEDDSGNTVYTDATAEPAVDTVVYSDQGTTQVGTVSEVA